jgi:LysM repeat protein
MKHFNNPFGKLSVSGVWIAVRDSMGKFAAKGVESVNMPVILAGAGMVSVILFFIIAVLPRHNYSEEIKTLEENLSKMEKRLDALDRGGSDSGALESMNQQIKALADKVDQMHNSAQNIEGDSGGKGDSTEKKGGKDKKGAPGPSGPQSASIKPSNPKTPAKAADKSTSQKAPAGKETPKPASNEKFHTVGKNDTLYSISARYGLTVDQLCKMNKLPKKATLQPNQKIYVGK